MEHPAVKKRKLEDCSDPIDFEPKDISPVWWENRLKQINVSNEYPEIDPCTCYWKYFGRPDNFSWKAAKFAVKTSFNVLPFVIELRLVGERYLCVSIVCKTCGRTRRIEPALCVKFAREIENGALFSGFAEHAKDVIVYPKGHPKWQE